LSEVSLLTSRLAEKIHPALVKMQSARQVL